MVVETLNHYSKKLEISGYSASTRADVLKASIQIYSRIRSEEDTGKRPLYRSREWHEVKRNLEKETKKSSWSKTGQRPGEVVRAPLMISPLAGCLVTSEMKRIRQKFSAQTNIHVKVVTRGGNKITRDLKLNPRRVGGCHRENCMVCFTGGQGDCNRSGAGYRISCLECPKVKISAAYEGETARNPYTRGMEHSTDLENENKNSPLWKHFMI